MTGSHLPWQGNGVLCPFVPFVGTKMLMVQSTCWNRILLNGVAWQPGISQRGEGCGKFIWTKKLSGLGLLVVPPDFPDVAKGVTILSGEETSLPGFPSFIHLGIRKCLVWVTFPWLTAVKGHLAIILFLKSGILDQLSFLLSPFRVLLCLPLTLFPEFIAVFCMEEQGEMYLHYLV